MPKFDRKQFKTAARSATAWTRKNALPLSGLLGLTAGAFVALAGASSLFEIHNPGMLAAGVLEITSFWTTFRYGNRDKDAVGTPVAQFSLSKSIHPKIYPYESFIVQQGFCGLGYIAGGTDGHALFSGDFSSAIETTPLVIQGGLCTVSPFVGSLFKNQKGFFNPRRMSSHFLFASSAVLAWAAVKTGSPCLGVASACFLSSNWLSGESERQRAPALS